MHISKTITLKELMHKYSIIEITFIFVSIGFLIETPPALEVWRRRKCGGGFDFGLRNFIAGSWISGHQEKCKESSVDLEKTVDESPFPVAVFCGSSKPDTVNDFLYDIVDELTNLKDGSLDIEHEISIKGFVCDAPARAFLKCIKNHNGYFGCEKCCQKGKRDNNRMTFPDSNAPKRKDSDFDSFSHDNDSGYILEKSPLLKVDIGLVTQFPLDYMHMVCLGVMRKLLISWCRGPLNVHLCSRDIDILPNREEWEGFQRIFSPIHLYLQEVTLSLLEQ
ncbi:hypothetical protein AVEN_262907-1 [Araneus ventricosus]|uniref:Transposase domain-containing protein n=1 Tax=Araneus ventricosus TaxID=182803 RepID=A0A4Y2DHQ3_ARAVE|nr:hypothetical protein AVEN_262907-1 [Araneus ventricosus]